MIAAVLAHQGGWDEILLVLLPLAVFGLLLAIARRRVLRLGDGAADDEPADAVSSDTTSSDPTQDDPTP